MTTALRPAALLGALIALLPGCDSLTWVITPPGAPAPPNVAEVESPTRLSPILIGGTKPAGTGVMTGDDVAVPVDGETSFAVQVDLVEGEQEIELRTFDGQDRRSDPVSVTVVLDTTPPAALSLDAPPTVTAAASVTLTGTREPGAAVWVDGEEALAAGEEPAFSVTRSLSLGPNEVRLSARDALGNESPVSVVEIVRIDEGFLLEPPPALINTATLTLTVTLAPGVAVEVDGEEVLAGGDGGTFAIEVDLEEGEHVLEVAGVLGATRWEETVEVTVDLTAPGTPMLDPVPALSSAALLPLSGSLPDPSSLVVNGQVVLADAPAGGFSTEADLGGGALTLDVRARDAAGNLSEAVDPVPTVYVNPAGLVFSLDPAPAAVPASPVELTGTRGADVGIYVDGAEALAPDGSTEFSLSVPLDPGENELLIEGRAGPASVAATVVITLSDMGPGAPVLDGSAITSASASVTVTGTRAPDTAVLRNGVVAVPAGPTAAFSDPLTVAPGVTELRYRLRDALGRTGPEATVTVTYAPDAGPVDGGYDAGPGLYDAGLDGGVYDAGAVDGGYADAGVYDAGLADGGAPDAGAPVDSGGGSPTDAGPADGA